MAGKSKYKYKYEVVCIIVHNNSYEIKTIGTIF
jgi:hypothetical protein